MCCFAVMACYVVVHGCLFVQCALLCLVTLLEHVLACNCVYIGAFFSLTVSKALKVLKMLIMLKVLCFWICSLCTLSTLPSLSTLT